jgi:glycerol kinase
MGYILALDQGTTSSRAIIFNARGEIVQTAQKEYPQIFPRPGWVEHDPLDIWSTQLAVAQEALKGGDKVLNPSKMIAATEIKAIAITNQRETSLLWDRKTGQPLANAIVWQDRRTTDFCQSLRDQGHAEMIANKTGLVIDSYFSATKLKWLLDNIADARERARRGELAFGTIDSWLVWNLTGGNVHVTDVSNASRTMLFNINTLEWDQALLDLFDIPREVLPQVVETSGVLGQTAAELFGAPIPIASLVGDQQGATFGQACFKPGMAKNTFGTGCFMLMNTGLRPVTSKHKLLTTIGWQRDGYAPNYCLEGSVFMGGAIVQWLRDGLGIIQKSSEIEALAASVPDTGDTYLVPAFTGLGAPDWDGLARGTIVGMTRGTQKAHLARAALEAISLQVAGVLSVMEQDAGISLTELRVDGGASQNNLLMQMQADFTGVAVVRPKITETTALGAAYLAGLATGFWTHQDELEAHWAIDRRFEPQLQPEQRLAKIDRWKQAVDRSRGWAQA